MGLRAHWFQHAPFEGLGSIEGWLSRKQARVSSTFFHDERAVIPDVGDFDLLIIMGGPMSVNDETAHPWLKEEKKLIARAMEKGKPVLGVCLGAQLIASALGARVRRNPEPEIGWFPVERIFGAEKAVPVAAVLPGRFDAFHWHGETFELPPGAVRLARSEACENQAFVIGDRVVGLQFHPEATPEAVRRLVDNCRAELVPGRFVQSEQTITSAPTPVFGAGNELMDRILGALAAETGK